MRNKTHKPALEDLDFLYIWTLDKKLEVLYANELAESLSMNPFEGMRPREKEILSKFIIGKSESHLSSVCLPWSTSVSRNALWLKWKVKRNKDCYYLTAVNVTDIKRSELYLGQVLDAIPDLILVKGKDSQIVWANKAFQDHYGLSNKELRNLIDAPYVEPDYTNQYIIDDKKVWDSGKQLLVECEPVVRHDGVVRKFQTLKTPIFGPDKKVIYTVGVSRDITDKIEHEEKSVAAAKMTALGEMAGGVAHEVNNPIAVISGKVYLFKRLINKFETVKKENVIGYLDSIEQHAERIAKIIDTLRRLSADDDYEDFSRVNLSNLVADTLLLSETKIKEKGINLITQIPKALEIDARKIQLSQAILNLLNNATEAAENSPERWIKVTAKKNKDQLELRVEDSGPGVPKEIVGRIMQPFFTTKDIGKGVGLGLTFALSVAKNHHGTLKIDRNVSPSCFLMTFPIRRPPVT